MRTVEFVGDTFADFADWVRRDKKAYLRIVRLINESRRTPFEGVGKPEPLRGNLAGFWSRRITDEHRLVYQVTDDTIIVQSVRGHYDD